MSEQGFLIGCFHPDLLENASWDWDTLMRASEGDLTQVKGFETWKHLNCIKLFANSLRPYRLQPTKLLYPWDSSGKNTGVGCHALLQGIFPTQESNLHLLCLLHPLMSPASAGGFFTTIATWEAQRD